MSSQSDHGYIRFTYPVPLLKTTRVIRLQTKPGPPLPGYNQPLPIRPQQINTKKGAIAPEAVKNTKTRRPRQRELRRGPRDHQPHRPQSSRPSPPNPPTDPKPMTGRPRPPPRLRAVPPLDLPEAVPQRGGGDPANSPGRCHLHAPPGGGVALPPLRVRFARPIGFSLPGAVESRGGFSGRSSC
jgi:hypothetical protein